MDVLVVDDEDIVRDLMVEILARAGLTVHGAATADDALLALETKEIDVVVTDALMPHISGFELLQELKRIRPELPVIVATAAATERTFLEARAAGAIDVLTKPFTHAELVEAVLSAARRSPQR